MSTSSLPASDDRTLSEEEELRIAWEIASRKVAERAVLGNSPTYDGLLSQDWRIQPVGPEEFLTSDKYAGRYGSGLYPRWREDLIHVLEPTNGISEWILTGCIGAGKSTVAALALTYKLYRMGCMLDPCKFFALMRDSSIVFGVYSLFKYKSQDDNHELLKTMIDGIPFFRECFPRPKHISAHAADELTFPNRVRVIAGSTELHAIGLNLLCLLMDEVNFMKEQAKAGTAKKAGSVENTVSQAQNLYTGAKRRLESRFHYRGTTPGLMILISSRNAESSWLERHIAEVEDRPNCYISDYPLWEIKPKQNYTGKRFFVEVGDALRASRIIDSPFEAVEGARVVSPPVEHLGEFEADIEGALRDIAGVANVATSALIKDKDALQAAVDPKLSHPFTRPAFEISHLDDIPIKRYLDSRSLLQIVRSFPRPRLNPQCVRYIHVDLAETSDSAGFAMGHLSSTEGAQPRVTVDMMLRILAPARGEIDFSKIVEFILYLHRECGYPIKRISFDRFQSTHARQILTKEGFESPAYSVDKTDEAYLVLRQTIYEARLSVYDYRPFFDEMSRLVHDRVARKVDHPPGGTKDVSDAVASVVFQLTQGLASDDSIRGQSAPGSTIMPEPVMSLQERIEQAGNFAAVAAHRGRLV